MAASLGIAIDWRPFTLDIPSYLGSARLDRARSGRELRAHTPAVERRALRLPGRAALRESARQDAARHGQDLGLEPGGHRHAVGQTAGRRALRSLPRRGLRALLAPRARHRGRRRARVGARRRRRRDRGLPGVHERAGRAEHDELNRTAFDAGVFGVPTFLVADEMWFGREHLPRVAWLLGGAEGPAPGVANRAFGP